jgi:hypothetical protein
VKNLIALSNAVIRNTYLLLSLFLVHPQAQAQSPISLQVDGGLSIASLKMKVLGMNIDDLHSLNGLQGRMLAGYALSDNLSIHTGLGLVQLGASEKHGDHHDEIRIDAMEFPLLLGFRMPAGPGSLGLSAGPALAYHLSARSYSHEDGTEEVSDLSIGNETSDFIKPMNLGLQAELSYTHRSGLLLNLRYNAGLMNLGNMDAVEMQTSYLGVGLGYRIF